MTRFYETRPYPLPLTLPTGVTAHKGAMVAKSELRYDGAFYSGLCVHHGVTAQHAFAAYSVDWPSVPLPHSTALPEVLPKGTRFKCSCGEFELLAPSARVHGRYQRSTMMSDSANYPASNHPICDDAVFTLPATPERPIQAGDWVECFRFKRVDGPHAVADEGPEPAPLHAGTDNGSCEVFECGGCRAPVESRTTTFCVYCSHSLENILLTREENDRRVALAMQEDDEGGAQSKARARLAAWSKPARPTASPKALAELARPHPWECDE